MKQNLDLSHLHPNEAPCRHAPARLEPDSVWRASAPVREQRSLLQLFPTVGDAIQKLCDRFVHELHISSFGWRGSEVTLQRRYHHILGTGNLLCIIGCLYSGIVKIAWERSSKWLWP